MVLGCVVGEAGLRVNGAPVLVYRLVRIRSLYGYGEP
jgi:hypothetical protein